MDTTFRRYSSRTSSTRPQGWYIVGSGSHTTRDANQPDRNANQLKVNLVTPVAQAIEMVKSKLKREGKSIRENGIPPADHCKPWTITKSNTFCLLTECELFAQISYLPLSKQDVLSSIQIIPGAWENIGLSFFPKGDNPAEFFDFWVERLDTTIRVSNIIYWLLTYLDTNTYATDCKLWILTCVYNTVCIG